MRAVLAAAPLVLALAGAVAQADGPSAAARAAASEAAPDELGRAVYRRDCAVCHGADGGGNGEAAARLAARPRDFRTGQYKFRSTGSGKLPTDADLERSIVRGLPGTAMVAQNHLSAAEVTAVIAFIKGLHPPFAAGGPPRPLALPREPAAAERDFERGKRVYHDAGCDGCHGSGGKGDGAVAKDLSEEPANLTRRPLKGGSSATDILRSIVTGLDGTPMPSYHLLFDDADLWALARYVESLGGAPSTTADEKLGWEIERRDPATGRPLPR